MAAIMMRQIIDRVPYMLKFLSEKLLEPALARLKGETPLDKETEDKFRRFMVTSYGEPEHEQKQSAQKQRQD